MYSALIDPHTQVVLPSGQPGQRVCEITASPFPVALPFFWVQGLDQDTALDHYWDPEQQLLIQLPTVAADTAMTTIVHGLEQF